jgi:pyridoxine kinase
MALNILSIQSSVAYGHVGNSAAVFALQRLGLEVWPVNTVHFSNHTGYGAWRGSVLPVETVADILRGIEERDRFPFCNGVLSGYMGDASLGALILDAAARVKAANPNAHYCCDPVMGDFGRGMFVRPGIPEFMKGYAVPAATLVTPNQFELEYLSGTTVSDLSSALAAVDIVRATGPQVVLVTSLRPTDPSDLRVAMLAVDQGGAYLLETPLLPVSVNGAGDATAALFFAHWLRGWPIADVLERATATIFAILEETLKSGSKEMELIAAQEAIVNPSHRFAAIKVR